MCSHPAEGFRKDLGRDEIMRNKGHQTDAGSPLWYCGEWLGWVIMANKLNKCIYPQHDPQSLLRHGNMC